MRVALKLMMAVLALVVCILAVEVYLRTAREAELFEMDVRRNQHVLGRALSAATDLIWQNDGPRFAQEVLETAELAEREIDLRIVNVDTEGTDESPAVPLPAAQLVRLQHGEEVVQMAAQTDPGMLYTYVPLSLEGTGNLALELSTSLRGEEEFLQASALRFLAIAAAMALVTAGGAMLLGNRLVGRPISALVEHARIVGEGEFSHHTTVRQRDELGQLGRELDAMADKLGRASLRVQEETAARLDATAQLRHADRLAAVGTLGAGIAHELGTPLHVVAGRAELASRRATDESVRRDLEIIREQCAKMERIVRELLTFARASTPDRRRHDIHEIVSRAESLVRPLFGAHDVEFELSTGGEPIFAEVAGEQIEQVLTNLFVNAVHAMPEGGRLMVSAEGGQAPPPALAGTTTRTEWIRLVVEDTGSGIDPDVLDTIFDPFVTTKDIGKGVGLGLSVAHGIVRDHGGVLLASNREPEGARFELWLPEGP